MQKKMIVKLPIADVVNGATRGLAIIAISGYQRFISPHKGFSCAHRVLYGCDSCSQYFKRVIAEEGIFAAIANAKGRFQECREANEILKQRRAKCQSRREYYASRIIPNAVAIESGDLGTPKNNDGSEDLNLPKESESPENQTDKKKLGGSQWSRKKRSQIDKTTNNQANNDGGGNNNCLDYIDCADFIDCADCADRTGIVDCDRLNCPDLNCDNADCLSGLDCNGCGDCGSLDCGSCG
jgi:putative component of membrane protein insertase Oxa1/YidC/SpoIIIJ protein YidD